MSMLARTAFIAATVSVFAVTAHAAPTGVDGLYSADYGAVREHIPYNAAAPVDFTLSPNATVPYSIYLKASGGYVYSLFVADAGYTPLPFANLYFDLDPAAGTGSDLGFETTNFRAFIPGGNGAYAPTPGIVIASSADGLGLEIAIPNEYFTASIAGLAYYPGTFPSVGDAITLRISQTFGYTAVGGESFGPDRLGSVTLSAAAVPEPASLGLLGLGVLGFGAVRRRLTSSGSSGRCSKVAIGSASVGEQASR